MNIEEFNTKVKEIAKETFAEEIQPTIQESLKAELDERDEQLKVDLTPDPEEEKAQNKANEAKWDKGEFVKAIYDFRTKNKQDNRLVFVDANGHETAPVHREAESETEVHKTMTEGTDSAGGFVVPTQFVMEVQELGLEQSIIRSNGATIFQMERDLLNIPRINESSHASSLMGGVVAYWTEEAGTKTSSEPKWGNCTLRAHELAGYTRASNALIADSGIALETYLKKAFGAAWSYYEDDAFINGTGVGQPLGILNAPCLITVTRQHTSSLYFDDLVNLYTRVLPESRNRAVWLLNHEVLAPLIEAGAGNAAQASGHQLVFISRDQGAVEALPKTIFGRPYILTEKMGALGDAGDIGLFDLSYYFIGDRAKLTIDTSAHVGFTTNTTYWRFTLRVDGQPWLSSALTPKNGTNTLSPFVTLKATS